MEGERGKQKKIEMERERLTDIDGERHNRHTWRKTWADEAGPRQRKTQTNRDREIDKDKETDRNIETDRKRERKRERGTEMDTE